MCHVKLWHYGSLNFLYFMEVHCAFFFFSSLQAFTALAVPLESLSL